MRYLFIILGLCLAKNSLTSGQISDTPKISERLSQEYKSGSHYLNPSKPEAIHTYNRQEDNYVSTYSDQNVDRRYDTQNSGSQLPITDQDNLLAAPKRRAITSVTCLKTHMIATFEFSTPFNGYIYPHDQFPNCILFRGRQSTRAEITLAQGACGENIIDNEADPEFLPVIEHRLMIQWEKDFVCVDDTSVIVRCDHPDSFNKTITWEFQTLELASTLERAQHPGPTMFMEIQEGEGPTAPPLAHRVYIGDTLTLVFTLTDDVFWFDSNMLYCTAVSGGGKVVQVDSKGLAPYTGNLPVIEDGCSLKPKIFSHFYKEKVVQDGNLITLHYATFKAFRFPTSDKILIQCDVQICYKECDELPGCQTGYSPRSSKRRKRSTVGSQEPVEPTKIELFKKTIEVWAPEDFSYSDIPISEVKIASLDSYLGEYQIDTSSFYTPTAFYSWVGILFIANILLLFVIVMLCHEMRSGSTEAVK